MFLCLISMEHNSSPYGMVYYIPAEGLWQCGDDGTVPRGIVIQLKQGRRNQLVVPRNRKQSCKSNTSSTDFAFFLHFITNGKI